MVQYSTVSIIGTYLLLQVGRPRPQHLKNHHVSRLLFSRFGGICYDTLKQCFSGIPDIYIYIFLLYAEWKFLHCLHCPEIELVHDISSYIPMLEFCWSVRVRVRDTTDARATVGLFSRRTRLIPYSTGMRFYVTVCSVYCIGLDWIGLDEGALVISPSVFLSWKKQKPKTKTSNLVVLYLFQRIRSTLPSVRRVFNEMSATFPFKFNVIPFYRTTFLADVCMMSEQEVKR